MEPEREIEKLLRTYARKRRDDMGAPPELHPATRRRLQNEVARRALKGGERNFLANLFTFLQPRLALAAGALAVALIAGWLVFSAVGKREPELAFDRVAAPPASRAVAEETVAPPQPDKFALDARSTEKETKGSEAVANALRGSEGILALAPNAWSVPEWSTANAAEPEKALPSGDEVARMQAAGGFFPATQRFVQVKPASVVVPVTKSASASVPPASVLNAFKWEQDGREVRMVDEDGSVYTGSLQLTNVAVEVETTPGEMAALAKNAPRAEAKQPWAQNYLFRVSGTNRNLKQNVVFTGNLLISSDERMLSNLADVATLKGSQFQGLSNLLQLPLANSRITGTVVIDNSKEIQINAVPARP